MRRETNTTVHNRSTEIYCASKERTSKCYVDDGAGKQFDKLNKGERADELTL